MVSSICIAQSADGPFGLWKGMTYQQVKSIDNDVKEFGDNVYIITKVPKPHKEFEAYMVLIYKDNGLCKIVAMGLDTTTNGYGSQIKSIYTHIQESLTKKYGSCEEIDMLYPGSIWDEPDDWMMSLLKTERYLTSLWSIDNGNTLSNSIKAIELDTHARNSSTGYLTLTYEFDNFHEVSAKLEAEEEDSF